MRTLVKVLIAAVIFGVVVFNASKALEIGKSSDFALKAIEAVANGEGGEGLGKCRTVESEEWVSNWYFWFLKCESGENISCLNATYLYEYWNGRYYMTMFSQEFIYDCD